MGAVDKNITIIHTSPWVNILWNKSFVLVRNKSIFEFLTSNHRFWLKHEYITHNIAFSSEKSLRLYQVSTDQAPVRSKNSLKWFLLNMYVHLMWDGQGDGLFHWRQCYYWIRILAKSNDLMLKHFNDGCFLQTSSVSHHKMLTDGLEWCGLLMFTFMHLADAFIHSDLQCIQAIQILVSICVPWESNPRPLRC